MRTNPLYDTWLFLIGDTPDHAGRGVGYLIVALFWALFIASCLIAWKAWRDDPAQRTSTHLATWFMRLMIGCMWFQGSLWKLPLPISGGFRYWTTEITTNAGFEIHKWIATNIFLPMLWLLNPLVYLTELSMAVAFMLGFMVRPLAAVGMLFVVQLWLGLYMHPMEWPWLYIFLIFVQGFFILHHAGHSLGLDGMIAKSSTGPLKGDGALARLYRRFA